jgi:hypothetical protein
MTRTTHDWRSESERAEIGRLEKVCDASEHWTLECSHTDVGDPWCIRIEPAGSAPHAVLGSMHSTAFTCIGF